MLSYCLPWSLLAAIFWRLGSCSAIQNGLMRRDALGQADQLGNSFIFRRRRTRRRAEATANAMDFGGAGAGTQWKGWSWSPSSMAIGRDMFQGFGIDRPAFAKSERCTDTTCEDCTLVSSCWHGDDVEYVEQDIWDMIKLAFRGFPSEGGIFVDVAAGSTFTSYVQEVSVKCVGNRGKWFLKVIEITNGKLEVFVNHILHTTIYTDIVSHLMDHLYEIPVGDKEESNVRVVFSPTDKSKESRSVAILNALNIDVAVEECMTATACLEKLGDQHGFEFTLRNNNTLQWQCLENRTDSFPDELKTLCGLWLDCMSPDKIHALKVFLSTVFGGSAAGGVLTEFTRGQVLNATEDPNTCVDPSVEDPETWQCNCLENMENECGGVDEVCFRRLMCEEDLICSSWKTTHCATTAAVTTAAPVLMDFQKRSARSKGEIAKTNRQGSEGGLDESLAGKCV